MAHIGQKFGFRTVRGVGQISSTPLKMVRITQATVLMIRKRRTRACMSEKTRSADPNQPTASSSDMGEA